jgi:hypothetical protein
LTRIVASIDIGAGRGAKLGLFDGENQLGDEHVLPLESYGSSAAEMADALASAVKDAVAAVAQNDLLLTGIGVACPGMLRSDGSLLRAGNLPFLDGANLGLLLEERLGTPAICVNDADAGAYGLWCREKTELFYWVLGGGWGGAWITQDGRIRFPSTDWDGNDASLHYSNEPGYAIPLSVSRVRELFSDHGGSYDRFQEICIDDLQAGKGPLAGPSGRLDCVRAEAAVSGAGRWRTFRALAGDDRAHEKKLSGQEIDELHALATCGKIIDKLAGLEEDTAVRTDMLFGELLGEAGCILLEQAKQDGCVDDVPIFLAGKPSRAFGRFGASACRVLRDRGVRNELSLSILETEGINANLLGAALLALNHTTGLGEHARTSS